MEKRENDSTRFCQPTQPITCANHGNHAQVIVKSRQSPTWWKTHMWCSVHVASVVQMTHMLMHHGGVLASQALTQRQQLATYFSALVHDFEHGGVNNDFLVSWLSERKEKKRKEKKRKEKKRKEKTTPFGVNLMGSQVFLPAAQGLLAVTLCCKIPHTAHFHMADMHVVLLAPYK